MEKIALNPKLEKKIDKEIDDLLQQWRIAIKKKFVEFIKNELK